MKVILDSTLRKKLLCSVDDKRAFILEFPADAVLAELYGVANELHEKLWEELEKQKEMAAQGKQDCKATNEAEPQAEKSKK